MHDIKPFGEHVSFVFCPHTAQKDIHFVLILYAHKTCKCTT